MKTNHYRLVHGSLICYHEWVKGVSFLASVAVCSSAGQCRAKVLFIKKFRHGLGNFRFGSGKMQEKVLYIMYKRNKYFILFHIIYINDDKIHTSQISMEV